MRITNASLLTFVQLADLGAIQGSVECRDDIDAMMCDRGSMDFHHGSFVQYIWRRFNKGDAITSLKKARWYLNRLTSELEKETARIVPDSEPNLPKYQPFLRLPSSQWSTKATVSSTVSDCIPF